jgi:hypothetical protein
VSSITRAALAFVSSSLVGSIASAQVRTPDAMTPETSRACERLVRDGTAVIDRAVARLRRPVRAPLRPLGYLRCVGGARGAWITTIQAPELVHNNRAATLRDGDVVLSFVAPNGAVTVASREALGAHARHAEGRGVSFVSDDLDGDGIPEAVFLRAPQGNGPLAMFTVRGGPVQRFTFSSGFAPTSREDVDRDGREDLIQRVDYRGSEACVREGFGEVFDVLAWVALRDGAGFVSEGDGQRAWLRAQCPERPTVFVPRYGLTSTNVRDVMPEIVRRIACGRAWGASPAAIASAMPARWPQALACTSAAELVSFAATIRPPIELSPGPSVSAPPEGAEDHTLALELDDVFPGDMSLDRASPAISRMCRANVTSVERSLASVLRSSQGVLSQDELDEFFGSFGTCYYSGPARDAWATAITSLRWGAENEGGDEGMLGRSRLWHFDAQGARTGSTGDAILRIEGNSSLQQLVGVYDFDGDGRSEAIVRSFESDGRDSFGGDYAVFTARGGTVRPYEPAAVVPQISGIIDQDEDERPDLVDRAAFLLDDLSGPDDSSVAQGPTSLAHGLADGSFSRTDATAREFLRAQCPRPPERLVRLEEDAVEPSQTLFAIVCARLYGESSQRVVQRLNVEWRRRDEDQARWFLALSRASLWRVPFTLTPPPLTRPSIARAAGDAGVAP